MDGLQVKASDLLYWRLDSYFGDASRTHIPALTINLLAEVVSHIDRWPALKQALAESRETLIGADVWDEMLVEMDYGLEAHLAAALAGAPICDVEGCMVETRREPEQGCSGGCGGFYCDEHLRFQELGGFCEECFAGTVWNECAVCGCTDEDACEDGCWWIDDPLTEEGELVCSSCSEFRAELGGEG